MKKKILELKYQITSRKCKFFKTNPLGKFTRKYFIKKIDTST